MNNKRGIALISLLLLTLVGIVSFGVISDNKLKRKNQEEYNEWLKEKKQESVLGVSEKTEEEKSDFYTKILLKEKVNILIIGDRIALSDGRDSQNGIWSEGIKYILNKNYGVNSEVKILAESTDSIDKALVYANSNIIGNYDLIIMCYGYNDSLGSTDLNKFKYIYNQAIKKAK